MKLDLRTLVTIALTVAIYLVFRAVHRRARSVFTLPVLGTATVLIAVILATKSDPATYLDGAAPIGWFLGPATVALAVPLYRERARLRRHALAVLVPVACGATASLACVLLLGRFLRLDRALLASLAPKSVTTPIAMPIAERLGGAGPITAVVVVVTGLLGMAFGPRLLDLAGVRSKIARGLAMGTSAHGIGTARALEEGDVQGATSGVAMVISGVITVAIAPLMMWLLT